MTTTEMTRPAEGQTWRHRQYTTRFEVVLVSGTRVKLKRAGVEDAVPIGMDAAQLNHHYELVPPPQG